MSDKQAPKATVIAAFPDAVYKVNNTDGTPGGYIWLVDGGKLGPRCIGEGSNPNTAWKAAVGNLEREVGYTQLPDPTLAEVADKAAPLPNAPIPGTPFAHTGKGNSHSGYISRKEKDARRNHRKLARSTKQRQRRAR